jgi:hypothetical protein
MQACTKDGQFLFHGGWNLPVRETAWEASALFVSLRETIWVADITSHQWRLYDRSGTRIAETPFNLQITRPRAALPLSDGRLVVADDSGQLLFFSFEGGIQ